MFQTTNQMKSLSLGVMGGIWRSKWVFLFLALIYRWDTTNNHWMLHGAGVFTYKTGWFWWGKCWQLFQHHGTYGVTNIAGYNDTTSGFDGFKSSMQMDLTNSWIYIYNRIYNQQHMGYVELLGGLNAFSLSKVGDLTIKTLGIWPQKAIWWGYNVIDTQQNDTGVPK
jgi:hypothetical protein